MDAADVEDVETVSPGPIDRSVLTQQQQHRSNDIWEGEDPGALECRGCHKDMAKRDPMVDDRVIDIIKLLGLEGLYRTSSREIDQGLISALVERWRPETHTFHLPHGEMTITLQDVEVILGIPIDGEVLVGPTLLDWRQECNDLLGFTIPLSNTTVLMGQRILIKRLLEHIALPLSPNAQEVEVHQYARCYILALLGDTIFMDKSGDRVHLMFLEFLRNLRNPPQYSWGSACLAWLYRELCRASHKDGKQIGGAMFLVQYWAWARFPHLCPKIVPPPEGANGPSRLDYPLSIKWVWVPCTKNRLSYSSLVHYREQLCRMQSDQVMWQPYESELSHLPAFCVTGKDMWRAVVPLMCFCIVEKHQPDRVLRQFGLMQDIPVDVDTNERLHGIDLSEVDRNWRVEHAVHIHQWGNRYQLVCHAPTLIGDMPRDHRYFRWYRRITRKYIDRNSALLDFMIKKHLELLQQFPVGSPEHKHILDALKAVNKLDCVGANNDQANIGLQTK